MQNIAAQHFWDVEYLKQHKQAGLERQFDKDWQRALAETFRDLANDLAHHCVCRSARCRRARRCAGTNADCRRQAELELQPEELQQLAEEVYLRLQEERRAAACAAARPRPHRSSDTIIKTIDETHRAPQSIWHRALSRAR
jgi:hypothetical protein